MKDSPQDAKLLYPLMVLWCSFLQKDPSKENDYGQNPDDEEYPHQRPDSVFEITRHDEKEALTRL